MKLKPLDIVLFEGNRGNIAELIVMTWSKSPWSHCVWVKNEQGDIFDPNLGGILDGNLSDYGNRYRTVCRLTEPLSDEKISQILNWAYEEQKVCEGYDILAWLGFGTGIKYFEDPHKYYCSEFPYWGFMENEIILTPKEETFIYPNFFLYDKRWPKKELFETILWEEIEI